MCFGRISRFKGLFEFMGFAGGWLSVRWGVGARGRPRYWWLVSFLFYRLGGRL